MAFGIFSQISVYKELLGKSQSVLLHEGHNVHIVFILEATDAAVLYSTSVSVV